MQNWYAVHTKPRQESIAEDNLQQQSFETYLPRIKEVRRCKGKWRDAITPLFPRYLFISLEIGIDNISVIRHTRGVTGLLQFGNNIVPVPKSLIDSLKFAEDKKTGVHLPARLQFETGDYVTVTEGPLRGLQGIFKENRGEKRVVILLNILGRANSVILNHNQIIETPNW